MCARARFIPTVAVIALLTGTPATLSAQQSAEARLQEAIYKQQVEGDIQGAIALFGRIATESADDRAVAAQALLQLGLAHETLGSKDAEAAYRRLVRDYPDQENAARQARERLAVLAPSAPEPTTRSDGLTARMLRVNRQSWTRPGSISPDGREIALVDFGITDEWRRGNTGDLVVVGTESDEIRIVGKTGSGRDDGDTYVLRGVWSKDGGRLAFSVWSSQWDHQVLRIVDADGSNDRVVSDNLQHAELRPGAWASDASYVVALIVGWDGVLRLGRISTNDGTVTTLKTLGKTLPHGIRLEDMSLSLSPDDRFLAYAYHPTPREKPDIHVLAMDGSGEHVVAPSEVAEANPHWTPDGRRLVYLSDRSGNTGLWAVAMDEGRAVGEPELIQPHTGPILLLGFTADGALAYKSTVPETDLRIRTVDWRRGRFVGDEEPLTGRFVGYNQNATFSPDGRQVAFISRRPGPELDGSAALVIRSLEDGSEREFELDMGLSPETRPEWSGDGRAILLQAYDVEITDAGSTRRRAAYRIDVESGEIASDPFIRDYATFWGGAHARFVTERQSEGLRALGVRIIGQRDMNAFAREDEPLRPGESLLAVQSGGIRWVRAFGCERAAAYPHAVCQDGKLVERLTSLEGNSGMTWDLSPDGRTLAYLLPSADRSTRELWIWPISEDTEPRRLIEGLARTAGTVRWTSDGRELLYGVAEDPNDVSARIYRVDAAGGEPELLDLTMSRRQLGELAIQPGGDHVVLPVSTVADDAGSRAEIWLLSGFPWERE